MKSVLWSKLLLKTIGFQPWWGVGAEHTSELPHLRGMEAAVFVYQLSYVLIPQHKEECSQLGHSCCSGMVIAEGIHPGHRQQGCEILLPWPRGKGCHLLTPSFVALQERTWEILGSYKKGRWASTWDGHFPRYRICRDLIIGVENVVTVHGISWHGLPGVGNCLWM